MDVSGSKNQDSSSNDDSRTQRQQKNRIQQLKLFSDNQQYQAEGLPMKMNKNFKSQDPSTPGSKKVTSKVNKLMKRLRSKEEYPDRHDYAMQAAAAEHQLITPARSRKTEVLNTNFAGIRTNNQ